MPGVCKSNSFVTTWLMSFSAVIGLFLMSALPSLAQEFRASIRGGVTDPSGAPTPGAVVTAVSLDTRQTYTDTTGPAGTYALQYLLPGPYRLTVEAKGFTKKVYPNISLESAQKLSLDVTMELGANVQEIQVTASPGLLTTDTASTGTVLDQLKIENIPSEGQQAWQDILFTQSVHQLNAAAFEVTPRNNAADQYSVNGAPITSNAYYINGAPVSDKGTWYFVPLQDAIQELQSASPPYDAQYGRAGGGSFNAIVKSGTNRRHGALYYYNANSLYGANTYAANLNGLPKGVNNETTFGASAGGPIRKDRTFIFAAFGGFRQALPVVRSDSVPPASWRPQADGSVNLSAFGFTIYDPSTTFCATPSGSGCSNYSRNVFPNNIIPAGRVSPIGKAILKFYPLPNNAGIANNYNVSASTHFSYDQFTTRVDHNVSVKTRLYGLFEYQRNWSLNPQNAFTTGAINSTEPSGTPMNGMVDLTHTFSPSLVGDLKLSVARYTNSTITGTAIAQNLLASSLGLNMPFVPTTSHQNLVPTISVSGFTALFGNTMSGSAQTDRYLSANLAKMKGHHSFRFGFDFMGVQSGATGIPGQPNGTFSFMGAAARQNPLSGGTNSAQALADLLLGYPSSGSTSWSTSPFVTYQEYGLYFQDDYKIRRNLTFNLGLRWDIYTSPRERYNGINAGFCFTCTNPYNAQINHTQYPNLPNPLTGGLLFAGANGAPAAPFNVQMNDFQPRFGVAWAVSPKWVLRAGYGIFSSYGLSAITSTGFSQSTSYVNVLGDAVTQTDSFRSGNPYPSGVIAPAGVSGGLQTAAGQAITYNTPDRRSPLTQQWTIGFQRELPKRILLDVEYAGSHTSKMAVSTQLDTIPQALAAQCFLNNAICNASVSNPFYGVLPSATSFGSSATIAAWNLTKPWPLFNGIMESDPPAGSSHYNALNVRVERKVHTLDFVFNYTYSNWMDRNSYLNNSTTLRDATFWSGPDASDIRHYVTTSVVWPLPFGHGQSLAKSASRWVQGLIGGWTANSTVFWRSGLPMDIPTSDFISGPKCVSYIPPAGQSQAALFNNNVSCYRDLAPYEPSTSPLRVGYLRYPHLFEMAGALQKKFALPREGMFLQFRAEAVNLTNTPMFLGGTSTNNDQPPRLGPTGWTGFGTRTQSQSGDPRFVTLSLKLFF